MKILPFYNQLKIANKLKFLSIFSAIISGAILISLLYVNQYMNERESAVKESKVFAKILADNIAVAIINKNLDAISNTLASVEYNNKISKTFALDNSWKMLGAFHKGDDFKHQKEMIPLIRKNQNLWQDGHFYSVAPIFNKNNDKIGNLVVVVSLADFHYRMLINSIVILFIVLFAVVLTTKFRRVLEESILIPIAQLDEATTQIIKSKDMSHKINIVNHDEIGSLALKFQNLLFELEMYHKEINAQKDILSHQSNHDSLTELPNRAYFHDRLNQSIANSERNSQKFALFFIDLDDFKEINDTFGHEYGDLLLVKIAERFNDIVRQNDTLARLGGDEFTIIMNNIKEYHTASILAQKILDILNLPFKLNNELVKIGCSIGISLYPKDSTSPTELIKYADIAMYRSKKDGHNNYNFYENEMMEAVLERVVMQAKIRKALDKKEFIVYYQPQYILPEKKIIGFEALVRWFDEDGTMIYPDQFLPLAQEVGLIVGINHQVMKMAMLKAKEWDDAGINPGRVSVNINIEQLEDSHFPEFIEQLLLDTGCKSQWIMLEITENQLMENPTKVIETIKVLNDLGYAMAIDDFGTGYSSLSYLKHLCIHEIKIDKSFVSELPNNHDDGVIVSSIITLANSLGLEIIAEGVETKEQEEFLLQVGCHNMQGYLYSRPLPEKEATALLLA